MPYSASALGVLPPLWSRAAKKPRPVLTFSDWIVFTLPYSGTSRTGADPHGADRGDQRDGHGRPPRRQTAGRPAPNGPNRAARPHGHAAWKFTGLPAREEREHRNGHLPYARTRWLPSTPEVRSPHARKTEARTRKYSPLSQARLAVPTSGDPAGRWFGTDH